MYIGKTYAHKDDPGVVLFKVLEERGDTLILDNGARCKIETLNETYMEIDPATFFNTKISYQEGREHLQQGQQPQAGAYSHAPSSHFLGDAQPVTPTYNSQPQQQQQYQQSGPPPIGTPLVKTYGPGVYVDAPEEDYFDMDDLTNPGAAPKNIRERPLDPALAAPGQVQQHIGGQPSYVKEAAFVAPEDPEVALFRRVKRNKKTTLKLSVDVEVPTPTAGATMNDMFETSYVDFLTDEIMQRMASDKDFLRQHVRQQIDVYINGPQKKKRVLTKVAEVVAEEPKKKRTSGARKPKEAIEA